MCVWRIHPLAFNLYKRVRKPVCTATGRVLPNEEKYMEISTLVIMRLWGFLHSGGKENPGGAYLQLVKATQAMELKNLLLFSCY